MAKKRGNLDQVLLNDNEFEKKPKIDRGIREKLSNEYNDVKKTIYNSIELAFDKNIGSYEKLSRLYHYLKKGTSKALDSLRPLLASLYTMGIVESKWGEDWGSKPSLHLPSGTYTTVINGATWYAENFMLEAATILGILATAKNKVKTAACLGAYEAISLFNYYLFDQMKAGALNLRTYGVIWNDTYYFLQLPLLFLSLYTGGYFTRVKKSPN